MLFVQLIHKTYVSECISVTHNCYKSYVSVLMYQLISSILMYQIVMYRCLALCIARIQNPHFFLGKYENNQDGL